tara:strand:+ start:1142 stop:1357 length:216 start_codon:yes stop_codon:yes gene_type:complete
MKIVIPANPIRIYQRNGDTPQDGYSCHNVAFIMVKGESEYPKLIYVTISGTQISTIAFARVLINGEWVSHE